MRLQATCNTCRRTFVLMQILPEPEGSAGRCPFCGAHFGRHYLVVLPEAIRAAEAAEELFVAAVNRLTDMRPGFRVDTSALLARLGEELGQTGEAPTKGAA